MKPSRAPSAPHGVGEAGHDQPDDAAMLRWAVSCAVRAPSSHNTQPWRFRVVGDRVELHADRSRALPVVDPEDRALIISCGCALALLGVALRHAGRSGDVVLRPDPATADLLATVGTGPPHETTERDHRLFEAIAVRHTHRSAFGPRPVPPPVLAALSADADRFCVSLHTVGDAATKRQVADLVARGDRAQLSDPRFRRELASWIRSNYSRRGDGMPGFAFGIRGLPSLVGPLVMRTVDMSGRQAEKDERLTETAPALLLLTTRTDTPTDWLAVGQALGTLLLTATAAGLAASFLNQPIETAALRDEVGHVLDPTGGRPQLLLRLGFPESVARPTPRRPVTAVLLG